MPPDFELKVKFDKKKLVTESLVTSFTEQAYQKLKWQGFQCKRNDNEWIFHVFQATGKIWVNVIATRCFNKRKNEKTEIEAGWGKLIDNQKAWTVFFLRHIKYLSRETNWSSDTDTAVVTIQPIKISANCNKCTRHPSSTGSFMLMSAIQKIATGSGKKWSLTGEIKFRFWNAIF